MALIPPLSFQGIHPFAANLLTAAHIQKLSVEAFANLPYDAASVIAGNTLLRSALSQRQIELCTIVYLLQQIHLN